MQFFYADFKAPTTNSPFAAVSIGLALVELDKIKEPSSKRGWLIPTEWADYLADSPAN